MEYLLSTGLLPVCPLLIRKEYPKGIVLSTLKILEPRLTRLSVLVTGAGPIIHGDIGIGRLVPIPLMGEGMGRLMTLVLAIAAAKNGTVMIDDVDTGLHYSIMPKVWEGLRQMAQKSNVQVFTTTHSWECMRAAHDAFSGESEHDLCVQRLDRTENVVKATRFDYEMTETALEAGMELR